MNRSDLQTIEQHEQQRQQALDCRIFCCTSTSCRAAGSERVYQALGEAVVGHELTEDVEVVATGCMGLCSCGPLVRVEPKQQDKSLYQGVTTELASEIVSEHVSQGKPQQASILPQDLPFFVRQRRVVLANCGMVDPERIEEYIARGGYQALAHAVYDMTPEEICNEITNSGLRGRGGAGYPTGLKWDLVRKSAGDQKYVVANCDEGDPGAFMDRTLVESDPHRLLESMTIAGYAVGAQQGYIFVRGGYPGATERLQRLERAIRAAEQQGLLGSRVLDSNFKFRIDLRIGAGAFVCGEETALMASIMGRRGQPVPRPPYPAESGLWGKPTLINNVETFGNIVPIIAQGAEQYADIGMDKSSGTKVFALTGKVKNTGIIEVPLGITLREIVFEIGGGMVGDGQFKAAQTGGPSGGCVPADYLDMPVTHENLRSLGSIIGSGGLIIMDDQTCMPDLARFFMAFCMDESCGKCVPCRVGTVQMHRILQRITNGGATENDLTTLEGLCDMVGATSLCGLGQAAPNPVISTLRYFREEYETHIRNHECPAGVCEMTEMPIMALTEIL